MLLQETALKRASLINWAQETFEHSWPFSSWVLLSRVAGMELEMTYVSQSVVGGLTSPCSENGHYSPWLRKNVNGQLLRDKVIILNNQASTRSNSNEPSITPVSKINLN